MRALVIGAAILSFTAAGCGPTSGETGPRVLPHLSPVNFGNLAHQPSLETDPGCDDYAPCHWVLLLQSIGTDPVRVSESCIVGDSRGAFEFEGPVPVEINPGDDGAVRITYSHASTNSEPDDAALVVQSDAENFPTLVVPLCGRMVAVADLPDATGFECESPVTVEEGSRDLSLCGG